MPRVYPSRECRATAKWRENLAVVSIVNKRVSQISGDYESSAPNLKVRKTLDWMEIPAILALGSEEC
jgi:hypothetical protein